MDESKYQIQCTDDNTVVVTPPAGGTFTLTDGADPTRIVVPPVDNIDDDNRPIKFREWL